MENAKSEWSLDDYTLYIQLVLGTWWHIFNNFEDVETGEQVARSPRQALMALTKVPHVAQTMVNMYRE